MRVDSEDEKRMGGNGLPCSGEVRIEWRSTPLRIAKAGQLGLVRRELQGGKGGGLTCF